MKKSLSIAILFFVTLAIVNAQNDTTTYWYSQSHADYLKEIDGYYFNSDGTPYRIRSVIAPNGAFYTSMCDCTANPSPKFTDAAIVCMVVNGNIVENGLTLTPNVGAQPSLFRLKVDSGAALENKIVFRIAPTTDIEFKTNNGTLVVKNDGTLYLNGELIVNDPRLYDFARQFSEWVAPMIMDYYKKK